ncbi:MAG: hypothetical protein ACOX47_06525 [Bacillota bacterium]
MYELRESFPINRRGFVINQTLLLIIGLGLLYLFVAVGLPFLSQLAGFTEEHQVIIDEEIEGGAWFYIFVEKINTDIEPRVRHTMQFTPGMQKVD